jgi:hypothetical protein
MGAFGASRVTAFLAVAALCGTAATFWWALQTRSELQAAAGNHGASRSLTPKFTGRVGYSKDEHFKSGSSKFELMGKSEKSLSGPELGRNEDSNQPSGSLSPTRSLVSNSASGPSVMNAQADMPLPMLPALPALAAPPPRPPTPWQLTPPDALILTPPAPAAPTLTPPPAETAKRPTREPTRLATVPTESESRKPAPTAPARPAKPPAQSYYTEKFIEQGEYRYRRRVCEPPNMPDVCFMPQSQRHAIVVDKP